MISFKNICAALTLEFDPHLLRFLEGHVERASSIHWLTYVDVTLLLFIFGPRVFLLVGWVVSFAAMRGLQPPWSLGILACNVVMWILVSSFMVSCSLVSKEYNVRVVNGFFKWLEACNGLTLVTAHPLLLHCELESVSLLSLSQSWI